MPDMLRIYQDALRAYGLSAAGFSSLTHLHEAVSAMARTLRSQGANSFEQEFFRECIVRGIDWAPAQEMDPRQRADAASTVYTAFDGLPRKTTVLSTPTLFLRSVSFAEPSEQVLEQQHAS